MARPGLTGHRKFRRLSRALGSPILARGALELLWDSCYEAGDDYVGTAEDIEHAVGWSGEAGMLTRALAEAGAPLGVGFIERLEETGEPVYRVHDLWHHAPDYVAKRRRREMDRQGKSDPTRPPNGAERRRLDECQDGDVRPPSPSHSPSPPPSHGKNSAEPGPSSEPFLVFPIVGPGGPDWSLSEAQCAEWAALFPTLDVRAEAMEALAWVEASPGRRKTAKGMKKFLVGWFTRSTDRGAGRQHEMQEPPFTASELADAKRVLSNRLGRCPHDPTCDSSQMCIGVTIRTWRRQRQGAA